MVKLRLFVLLHWPGDDDEPEWLPASACYDVNMDLMYEVTWHNEALDTSPRNYYVRPNKVLEVIMARVA